MKSSPAAPGSSRSGTRLWSSEIGRPSSIRTRSSSNRSAPGAMLNASASSIVAGRTSARSTRRASASSPRERATSERPISVLGGSHDGVAADERAAAAGLDEPVGGELLDGAAHGRPAHPELLAQRPLGRQPVARLEDAALDPLGDLPVDAVIERLGRLLERHRGGLSQRRCRHVKPLGLFWFVVVRSGPWRSARPGCGPTCASCPVRLSATLDAASGVAEAAELLRCAARSASSRPATAPPTTSRTRSGSPRSRAARPARRSSPSRAGSPCARASRWQPGDAVLAVSSSGEFRDVVEIARAAEDRPCVAITASAGSSLAAAADGHGAPARRATSAPSRTRRRSRARTAPGSRCGPP